ncbi:MAG: PEP-CTERM sorting domain-containing protein [Phycisphaerales bacterium]
MCKLARLLVAGTLLAGASAGASADVLKALVDVGNGQGLPTSPDGNGNYWNQVNNEYGPAVALKSTGNVATGWTLGVSVPGGGTSGSAGFTGGLNVPSTGAPADFAVSGAYNDGWFDNGSFDLPGTFTFQGLTPATTYVLRLWGSRSGASIGWTDGSVAVTAGSAVGGPAFTLLDGSLGNVLTLTLTPSGSGSFAFTLRNSTGSDGSSVTGLNVLSLEVIPEPATLGLLAMGGLMMLPRRR